MEALENLHQRVSVPVLQDPAPNQEQLDNMFRAALRAPDHGALRPWRFMLVRGEARNKLGELYAQAAQEADASLSDEQLVRFRNMPLRAPLLVVAIACPREHPKVPRAEQVISAGCAVQNMLLAAHAQGVGAMWRTGDLAYDATVMQGLGLSADEAIIGYLYLGTPGRSARRVPVLDIEQYVSEWQ